MSLDRFSAVQDRALFRCAQPDADGYRTLHELGVTVIYKLNSEAESRLVDEVAAGFVVTVDEPNQWAPSAEWAAHAVHQINALLGAGDVVAIHCVHGRDRTGLLCAAWRVMVNGWTGEAALAEFRSFGVTGFIAWADHAIEECISDLYRRHRLSPSLGLSQTGVLP